MLVRDIMTEDVLAIDPKMPIGDAYALMEQRNIRHFPIMEASPDGNRARLVGIISDRDIRTVGSELPQAKSGVTLKDPVEKIMVNPVLTAHPLDPVEESAKILREHKIGAMPVCQDEELVGIVTSVDFLEALVKMTGVHGAATRLEVEVENQPGTLAELAQVIAGEGVNISSVLTSQQDETSISFVLRVDTIDGRGLARSLTERGFHVLWPTDKP